MTVLLALVVLPDRPAAAGSCGAAASSSVLLAVGSKLARSVCWVTVQLLGSKKQGELEGVCYEGKSVPCK